MIHESILAVIQTNEINPKLLPHAKKEGLLVSWSPDKKCIEPLKKVFKEVIRFDVGQYYTKIGAFATNKTLVDLVKKHSPKYIIWTTMTYEIFEETFYEIRKLGTEVILWFFDDEERFDDYSKHWIPFVDFIFTNDKKCISKYNILGITAYHMFVSANDDFFKPALIKNKYDVSFVGNKNIADREELIVHLLNNNIDAATFGRGWDNDYVTDSQMCEIYNSSKINLCFTKSYSGNNKQFKDKLFTITMCGGFLLTEYIEGIEEYFEIDKEISCFKDQYEMLEKINYYLAHDEERKTIASSGYQKCIKNYTQNGLFEKCFSIINKKDKHQILSNKKPKINNKNAHAHFHYQLACIFRKYDLESHIWKDELKLVRKYMPSLLIKLLINNEIKNIKMKLKNVLRKMKLYD